MSNETNSLSRMVALRSKVWLLISSACLVPAFLSVCQVFLQAKLDGRAARWQDLTFQTSEWLFLGILTPIAYQLNKYFPVRREHWVRTLALHAMGALLLCIGWASLGVLLGAILHRYPAEGPLNQALISWTLITLPYSVFMYFTVLGCLFAYSYFIEAKKREAQASRLAVQLSEARLGALRMQLNPHFLFNSLNAVSVLVRDKQDKLATRMLELLSDILRTVLRPEQSNEITLEEELSFLEQYLAIEQVRFSDRLRIQWNIEDVTRTAIVPSFILQPLLENAVKHGISQRADAGLIQVSAWLEVDLLYLSVRDDGYGIDPATSKEGVGLGNTRERLTTLYGIEASVTLRAAQGGGTEVVVQLPFKQVKR